MRRSLLAAIFLCASLPVQAATPFLWQPGAANSGLYAPALTVMSTELNALASGAVALSSAGGSAGVFSNANTGQVIWSPLVLTLGSTAGAFQTGGNLSCWFLQSLDGTTFESGAAAPPRAPDAIFPLPASALAATTTFLSQGLIRLPALRFKVLCQNNSGQPLNASGNTVVLAPTAVQY
ncbi:MAG TPA: hypothetical protein VGM07_10940 [Stellaceae bacterium]|jgi:hypothetical protein